VYFLTVFGLRLRRNIPTRYASESFAYCVPTFAGRELLLRTIAVSEVVSMCSKIGETILLQYRGFPYYIKHIFIDTENIFAESVLFVYFRNMKSDKNKRERGRPALPADQRRTARSVTAMSPAEMRAADDLAAIDGVPRSRAVANAVLETLERRVVPILVDKVAQKLREVAVNYAERERETVSRERGGLQPFDATVPRFAVVCEFARSPEEVRRKSRSRPEQRQELLEQLYAEAIRNRAEGYVSSFFQNELRKPEDRERRIRVAQEAVEKIIAEPDKVFGTDAVLFAFDVDGDGADQLYSLLEEI
jgi:hypothetical protein